MNQIKQNEFLRRSGETLWEIVQTIDMLPVIQIKELEPENTALIIVDMINGFAREGALKSPRVEDLIPEIAKLSKACDELHISKIAFGDSHTEASPEFDSYPPHCVAGTSESEIVSELKEIGGYTLIRKNSTNGFHEEAFQKWLRESPQLDTFIITGDCTDICVQQFSITMKTWFNQKNKKARVIVPANTVDTYDLGLHNGDLMHVMALYNMMINGIEVVAGVR